MAGRGDILKFFLQMPRRGRVSNQNLTIPQRQMEGLRRKRAIEAERRRVSNARSITANEETIKVLSERFRKSTDPKERKALEGAISRARGRIKTIEDTGAPKPMTKGEVGAFNKLLIEGRRGRVSNLNVPGVRKLTKEELETERTLLKRQKAKEDKRIEDLSRLLTRQKEVRRRREEMRDVTSGVTGAAVKARKKAERTVGKKTSTEKFAESLKEQRIEQAKFTLAKRTITSLKGGNIADDGPLVLQFRLDYRDASPTLRKKMRDEVERAGLMESKLIPKGLR